MIGSLTQRFHLLQEVPHQPLLLLGGGAEVLLVQHLQQNSQLTHQHLHSWTRQGQRLEGHRVSLSAERAEVMLTGPNTPPGRCGQGSSGLCSSFIFCHFASHHVSVNLMFCHNLFPLFSCLSLHTPHTMTHLDLTFVCGQLFDLG